MKKFIILLFMLLSLSGCVSYGSSQNIEEDKNITQERIDGELIIHFIDVGQGDSIFIELPNNKTMLIDGGEARFSSKIINYIDSLGYKRINYLLGTHPHADHIGGLSAIIETFDIENIYIDGLLNIVKCTMKESTELFRKIAGLTDRFGIDIYININVDTVEEVPSCIKEYVA